MFLQLTHSPSWSQRRSDTKFDDMDNGELSGKFLLFSCNYSRTRFVLKLFVGIPLFLIGRTLSREQKPDQYGLRKLVPSIETSATPQS